MYWIVLSYCGVIIVNLRCLRFVLIGIVLLLVVNPRKYLIGLFGLSEWMACFIYMIAGMCGYLYSTFCCYWFSYQSGVVTHMFESSSQAINFTTIINNKYNFRSHAKPKLVQLLAAFAHMSQLQWCSHAPDGPLEELLATHHSGVASWHLVLNNTSSTMPKVHGGPFF